MSEMAKVEAKKEREEIAASLERAVKALGVAIDYLRDARIFVNAMYDATVKDLKAWKERNKNAGNIPEDEWRKYEYIVLDFLDYLAHEKRDVEVVWDSVEEALEAIAQALMLVKKGVVSQ